MAKGLPPSLSVIEGIVGSDSPCRTLPAPSPHEYAPNPLVMDYGG